jgi:DNA-binding NarL/FixJ family response regulator
MKSKVLIVDDHKMYRDGLKTLINLQKDKMVVGEAANGQEAIAKTRELLPDVILMDVKMPVMDGVEATRRILADMPGTKILALSMYSDDGFMSGMKRALAYILKGSDFNELSAVIRRVSGSQDI